MASVVAGVGWHIVGAVMAASIYGPIVASRAFGDIFLR